MEMRLNVALKEKRLLWQYVGLRWLPQKRGIWGKRVGIEREPRRSQGRGGKGGRVDLISVKERLPEDDKDVLIHTAFGLCAFAVLYDDEWQDSTRVFAGVTHWMP